MATPVSGAISFADIQTAFGFGYNMANYQYSRWYQPASLIYGNFSATQISFSDFYNKQANDPAGNGSVTYSSASTNSFTVPLFRNTLTVDIWGAGGGGGGYAKDYVYGGTGNPSYVTFSNSLSAIAYGGTGGQDAATDRYAGGLVYGDNGVGGTASGNVLSTTGNAGYSLGVGAGAPSGGGDVAPGFRQTPAPNGSAPGGGGAGFYYDTGGKFPAVAGGAGSGGRAKSTWASAALPTGTTATVVVGGGGAPGNFYGGYGADGKITISWS